MNATLEEAVTAAADAVAFADSVSTTVTDADAVEIYLRKARACGFAILGLRAVFAAVDEQYAVSGRPVPGERHEALLHVPRE